MGELTSPLSWFRPMGTSSSTVGTPPGSRAPLPPPQQSGGTPVEPWSASIHVNFNEPVVNIALPYDLREILP